MTTADLIIYQTPKKKISHSTPLAVDEPPLPAKSIPEVVGVCGPSLSPFLGRDVAIAIDPQNVIHSRMKKNQTRCTLLKVVPIAAAMSIPLAQTSLFASSTGSGDSKAGWLTLVRL